MKRVAFDFGESAYAALNRLVVLTNADSKARVVQLALKLYSLCVNKRKEGYEVTLQFKRSSDCKATYITLDGGI